MALLGSAGALDALGLNLHAARQITKSSNNNDICVLKIKPSHYRCFVCEACRRTKWTRERNPGAKVALHFPIKL